ncbi:MAG: MerR family transcriptional regulator [Alphaproteobacteria bacterium]|nr:MerR family transcriptional regulator [Alphaproteobacteria bacterium]
MEDKEYFSSINEVSKRLSVPAHTLRYWEKQFPVAIKPTTGAGGRRYYRAETVERLIVIKDLLYAHGMTIAGVKKLLRDGNLPASASDVSSAGVVPAAPSVVKSVSVSDSAADLSVDNIELDTAISLLENARTILQ